VQLEPGPPVRRALAARARVAAGRPSLESHPGLAVRSSILRLEKPAFDSIRDRTRAPTLVRPARRAVCSDCQSELRPGRMCLKNCPSLAAEDRISAAPKPANGTEFVADGFQPPLGLTCRLSRQEWASRP
jgi:hypothetical protein